MWQPNERGIKAALLLGRWLVAPFILGLFACLVLIIYRFFADLVVLAIKLPSLPWQHLVVGILNLVDLTLVANLVLIIIFSAYENYIRKIEPADHSNWPPGLVNVDFGGLKQKILGSIAGIAAVDALAWYLDLEAYSDASKLGWAIGFPLMFVVAMMLLAIADWLAKR